MPQSQSRTQPNELDVVQNIINTVYESDEYTVKEQFDDDKLRLSFATEFATSDEIPFFNGPNPDDPSYNTAVDNKIDDLENEVKFTHHLGVQMGSVFSKVIELMILSDKDYGLQDIVAMLNCNFSIVDFVDEVKEDVRDDQTTLIMLAETAETADEAIADLPNDKVRPVLDNLHDLIQSPVIEEPIGYSEFIDFDCVTEITTRDGESLYTIEYDLWMAFRYPTQNEVDAAFRGVEDAQSNSEPQDENADYSETEEMFYREGYDEGVQDDDRDPENVMMGRIPKVIEYHRDNGYSGPKYMGHALDYNRIADFDPIEASKMINQGRMMHFTTHDFPDVECETDDGHRYRLQYWIEG